MNINIAYLLYNKNVHFPWHLVGDYIYHIADAKWVEFISNWHNEMLTIFIASEAATFYLVFIKIIFVTDVVGMTLSTACHMTYGCVF